MTPVGLPHSEISGSTPACDSPKLFAANHVLHRLLTPRHSPCALSSLTTNLEKLVSASLLSSIVSIAIRRLQGRDQSSKNESSCLCLNSPLTLDCFSCPKLAISLSRSRFARAFVSTQDTLSRRHSLLDFQRTDRGPKTVGEGRELYSTSRPTSTFTGLTQSRWSVRGSNP